MKFLYVSYIGRSSAAGVIKKTASKIKELRNYVPIEGLLLFNEFDNLGSHTEDEGIDFELVEEHYIHQIHNRLSEEAFDYVVMRYPGASKKLLQFLEKYPAKVFFEHNSIEVYEKRFFLKSFGIRDYLYQLSRGSFSLLKEWLLWRQETKLGPKCLSLAKGGIAVTQEIATFQSNRALGYQVRVISNGIANQEKELRAFPDFHADAALNMLFSSGSANEWHGLDRLLKGLQLYRGQRRIRLYIAGLYLGKYQPLIDEINGHANKEIACPGLIDATELRKLAEQSHVGVGSLGLHRIPLAEASTLKVREYCSYGLPFFISHTDVDMVASESFAPYFLQLPADDSPIDIEEVLAFVGRVYKKGDFVSELTRLTNEHLNTTVKMKTLGELLMRHENGE